MDAAINDLCRRLERFLTGAAGSAMRVTGARQLAGGASRESWSVDVDQATPENAKRIALVLRRDMGGTSHDESLSRDQEFRVIAAAHDAGVLVPRPRWICNDLSILNAPFFLMDRLEGETVGRRIVRDAALAQARKILPQKMGEQLARIHGMDIVQADLTFLPANLPGRSPAETALARALSQLWQLGVPHPALELAARWLAANAPDANRVVLVHGDFRVGNLMVGPDGLRGVLDWEFAHLGD